MRDPVGAFMLMVNWPASVRGKKESPSSGHEPEAQDEHAHQRGDCQAGTLRARRTQPLVDIQHPVELRG